MKKSHTYCDVKGCLAMRDTELEESEGWTTVKITPDHGVPADRLDRDLCKEHSVMLEELLAG